MTLMQKLLEMRERDNDIFDNLRVMKGVKYAEAVSSFANLLSITELVAKTVPKLSEPIRMTTCDVHQTMARVLEADFQEFMNDVVMVARSRLTGATAIAEAKKAQGGDRG